MVAFQLHKKIHHNLKKIHKRSKRHFHKVIKLKSTPHDIAFGFAVGSFIVILYTPLLNLILCFLAMLLFPKANKIALFGSLIVWNPITMIPIMFLSYNLGTLIAGPDFFIVSGIHWIDKFALPLSKYLIGNIIISVVLSLASYFVVKYFAQKHQDKLEIKNSQKYKDSKKCKKPKK